jgi:hypothetical protein
VLPGEPWHLHSRQILPATPEKGGYDRQKLVRLKSLWAKNGSFPGILTLEYWGWEVIYPSWICFHMSNMIKKFVSSCADGSCSIWISKVMSIHRVGQSHSLTGAGIGSWRSRIWQWGTGILNR